MGPDPDLAAAPPVSMLLIAPAAVPHGIRNTGKDRLLVLAILAPSP